MRRFALALASMALLGTVPPALVAHPSRNSPSVPRADAPELARLGPFAVGTKTSRVPVRAAPTLIAPGMSVIAPRSVSVRFWYPATSSSRNVPVSYIHTINARGSRPTTLVTPGIAASGAMPRTGRFPLVLISHGFRGWGEAMSYLGENLASKGYVVAAIDHGDRLNNDPAAISLGFGNVLLHRASDQSGVLRWLLKSSDEVAKLIDQRHIGLIGYSMGGFGALTTAGAPYDPASPTFKQLPADVRAKLATTLPDENVASRIGALVTIAPWGGQPSARVWTAASLARIRTPVLMIDGEDDDVVNYRDGVRWIHDALTSSDRWLLTYEAARHNVGNNAALADLPDFGAMESQAEPVWRGDRLNAINVHFITAFLDLALKNDRSRAEFLNVPTVRASDGVWPEPAGAPGSGALAGSAQLTHWRGFQRRWAIGLRLTHAPLQKRTLDSEVNQSKAERQ